MECLLAVETGAFTVPAFATVAARATSTVNGLDPHLGAALSDVFHPPFWHASRPVGRDHPVCCHWQSREGLAFDPPSWDATARRPLLAKRRRRATAGYLGIAPLVSGVGLLVQDNAERFLIRSLWDRRSTR
jgi:hypothetical protein